MSRMLLIIAKSMSQSCSLRLYFVCLLMTYVLCEHKSAFQSAQDLDYELHDHQIPPPYHQPSQEEIKTILSNLFKSDIDKDGDGFATDGELKDWIEIVHNKLIKENVDQQWQYYEPEVEEVHSWEGYNPEQREVLHWEKYVNLTYPEDLNDSDGADPNARNMKLMFKRAERRWKLADKNGDNVLAVEEYRDFIHPEESDRTKGLLIEEAMEDMDRDDNGEISLEEYMNHLNEMSSEEEHNDPNWIQVQQTHFTTYLDTNKDSVLNKEELKEWLVPTYDRHEAESLRLISVGDDNQDNKLSIDEILKYHDQYLSLITSEFWDKINVGETTTPDPSIHDEF